MNWRDELTTRAEDAVDRYVAARPSLRVDSSQPSYRGGTNCVTFGSDNGRPIVFKYFVNSARFRNELFALNHFASTGFVPKVLDVVDERMIVMNRLGGIDIGRRFESLDDTLRPALSRAVGEALAKLTQVPFVEPTSGYSPSRDFKEMFWNDGLRLAVARFIEIGRRIQREVEAYRSPVFDASLRFLAANRRAANRKLDILFHEDVFNTMVDGDHIAGFCDLELCRPATVWLQLGAALNLCGDGRLKWNHLREGFERERGVRLEDDDLRAILAMHHFGHWIRICRWGLWDGDPRRDEYRAAAEAEASFYAAAMGNAADQIGVEFELERAPAR
jgi:hypothetical protein